MERMGKKRDGKKTRHGKKMISRNDKVHEEWRWYMKNGDGIGRMEMGQEGQRWDRKDQDGMGMWKWVRQDRCGKGRMEMGRAEWRWNGKDEMG